MNKRIGKLLALAMSCALLISTYADKPEDINLAAVSPTRGSAVVKYKTEELKLVSIGENIPDTDLVLIQVLDDKIITEYTDALKNEHEEIDQIWIYKADATSKKSQVKYVKNFPKENKNNQKLETKSVTVGTEKE